MHPAWVEEKSIQLIRTKPKADSVSVTEDRAAPVG